VAGETVNSIGGWASAIVLWGFAAYRFGAGPDALAVTIVCWAVPPAVLSPLMGVYVDRFGPRAALVAGYCGAACCALAMAASGSLAELDAAAAARQDAGTGWFRELSQGIGLVARQRAARLVVLLSAAFTFTSASFLVVEPLYARHVLHRPPSQFALFEAAAGAGAILTGLAISRFRGGLSRLAGGTVLAASAVGYGLAACLFTGTTSVPLAYAGALVWGAAGTVFGAVSLTRLQQVTPVRAHGRVMGITATVQSWVETAALPLGGVTLAFLGVRAGALVLAGVVVAAGLAGVALRS